MTGIAPDLNGQDGATLKVRNQSSTFGTFGKATWVVAGG